MHLGAGGIEGVRAIDSVGGVAKFFFEGKLRGDAASGFDFAHATGAKAFELLLGRAEGHDESIQIFGESGFDEERGFHEGGIADPGALPLFELVENRLLDAGMKNGVEASEFGEIGERDRSELGAIDSAGGVG